MVPKDTYTDEELKPYFDEIAKGYCYKQSAENIGYNLDKLESTLNDVEVRIHIVDLSMVAGAKIRIGELPVPSRHDGLYDKYNTNIIRRNNT